MLRFLLSKIELIGISIIALFGFILKGKNSKIVKENQELILTNIAQDEIIRRQKRMLDAAKNTKPTDIAGNIKRMRDKKL